MLAGFVEHLGGPDEIRFGELPEPRPGPSDVLVEVLATTVNHVDTFIRSGLVPVPVTFPFVLGRDLVGRVLEAGPGAPGFADGDLVWCNSLGHGGRQGAAAERVVVPADRLYPLPPDTDPVDAVAVVHPAATAYLALVTHGRVRAGETVVIAGAAGNVGSALVELAVEAGAKVIATASGADLEYCLGLGASAAYDYHDPRLPGCLRGVADLHIDTSGTNDFDAAVEMLAFRGRIVLLAGAQSRPVLPAGELYTHDRSVIGFAISNATSAELAEAAVALNRHFARGGLRPRIVELGSLGELAGAHRRLERGELHGRRIVLLTEAARKT
ncbi:NADPH:quinone reductase [Amycolatopsis sp. NPDC058986]|uniref:NADPH:quinone reductase n=1 Tax=unclassified Amycolatopsis TaxID=2618356 RepID=UPI00366D04B5